MAGLCFQERGSEVAGAGEPPGGERSQEPQKSLRAEGGQGAGEGSRLLVSQPCSEQALLLGWSQWTAASLLLATHVPSTLQLPHGHCHLAQRCLL